MGALLNLQVELHSIDCGSCGGTYAINERYRQKCYEDGASWTCPYCKVSWGYSTGENAKLRKQLAEEKRLKELALSRENEERAARAAAEAREARLKKRVKAGTCPCCKRTVSQLARHMKSKHPEYAK